MPCWWEVMYGAGLNAMALEMQLPLGSWAMCYPISYITLSCTSYSIPLLPLTAPAVCGLASPGSSEDGRIDAILLLAPPHRLSGALAEAARELSVAAPVFLLLAKVRRLGVLQGVPLLGCQRPCVLRCAMCERVQHK